MNRVEVKQKYLMALLNYLEGEVYLWADLFIDEPLIRFELGPTGVSIEIEMDRNSYGRYHRQSWEPREMPGYDTFIESFFLSGILKFDGWDAFLEEVERARKADYIYGGSPITYFAIDASLHYKRFYTLAFESISNWPGSPVPVDKFGFVWAEGVREELITDPRKLRRDIVENLMSSAVSEDFRRSWLNNYNLATRKRLLALADFSKGYSKYPNRLDSERGDKGFVAALKGYISESRRVVVLAEDKDFQIYTAGLPGMKFIRLYANRSNFKKRLEAPLECLAQFLFVASVLYGRITLENDGDEIIVAGLWSRQDARDLLAERVLIGYKDSKPHYWDDLNKDLRILEKLEQ